MKRIRGPAEPPRGIGLADETRGQVVLTLARADAAATRRALDRLAELDENRFGLRAASHAARLRRIAADLAEGGAP